MNFIFSLQNIAANISNSSSLLIRNQLFLGFLLGYGIATVMYLFLVTENPRHVPTMILNSKSDSFQKISSRDGNGKFLLSYTTFEKDFNRLRIVIYSLLTIFLVIVAIALLFY